MKEMERIGQGCSRTAYLREDGKIVKKPRYNGRYNTAAEPDERTVDRLLLELSLRYPENKKLEKILTFMKKDYYIAPPCMGILAEYLVSLYVQSKSFTTNFALCEDIKVRKKANVEEVSIVGVYENAEDKILEGEFISQSDLPFSIGDLHPDNYVNGIVVDYANIFPKIRW